MEETEFDIGYSSLFAKPSYNFDCSIDNRLLNKKFSKCNFNYSCDKLMNTNNFQEKLNIVNDEFNLLKNKYEKLFLRFNLNEGEFRLLDFVLNNSNKISGLILVVDISNEESLGLFLKYAEKLNKDFILVGRNTVHLRDLVSKRKLNSFYYNFQINADKIVLSYVNKDLASNYTILLNQNTKQIYKGMTANLYYRDKSRILMQIEEIQNNNINFVVPLIEKIKRKICNN